jgi:hypothetical protein
MERGAPHNTRMDLGCYTVRLIRFSEGTLMAVGMTVAHSGGMFVVEFRLHICCTLGQRGRRGARKPSSMRCLGEQRRHATMEIEDAAVAREDAAIEC